VSNGRVLPGNAVGDQLFDQIEYRHRRLPQRSTCPTSSASLSRRLSVR